MFLDGWKGRQILHNQVQWSKFTQLWVQLNAVNVKDGAAYSSLTAPAICIGLDVVSAARRRAVKHHQLPVAAWAHDNTDNGVDKWAGCVYYGK